MSDKTVKQITQVTDYTGFTVHTSLHEHMIYM